MAAPLEFGMKTIDKKMDIVNSVKAATSHMNKKAVRNERGVRKYL